MAWRRKDLLELRGLTADDITMILDTAGSMREVIGRQIKKVPALRGRTVANIFYEPSTRTRISFELAAKYLSADVVNVSSAGSSVSKGESLADTARTIKALGADLIVLRHPSSGAAHLLARTVNAAVINAGDGIHEHPSQALLDLFTVRSRLSTIKGLKIAIIGDVAHSRVARSNIWGFKTMGAEVRICAPSTMLPAEIGRSGAVISRNIEEAIEGVDVIMLLRIQLERQQGLFPGLREYARLFGLNNERLSLAKPEVLVMHPGPLNRGVEIADEIADSSVSVINEQVTNGVAVRMALLYLLSNKGLKPDVEDMDG